jgi:hypothetical protein
MIVTRAAYNRLVETANVANARRRALEADRWAYLAALCAETGDRPPRPWRTDLRAVGSTDLGAW